MSNSIRPDNFNAIIGQDDSITRLRVSVAGCKNTGSVMPHVLIDGPPGLGKTTIAGAIANEMGVNLYTANAATIRSIKNIMPYIMGLSPRSVLFIDEIHRLPKIVEEFLYPVMEDFSIGVVTTDNDDKDVVDTIDIPKFTLIGATTSGGSLSQPFYDRFTIKEHLSFYSDIDLAKVARLNCDKMGIVIDDSDLLEIAKRSKGTPRILNGRLLWYKNYTSCYPNHSKTIDEIFAIQGIDEHGFDNYDRLYLSIIKKCKGSPIGLKGISSMTGIAIETIENSIEPYMVRKGIVIRTQKGRILDDKSHF
jgi:Holliday junction DNA helicase RuvB